METRTLKEGQVMFRTVTVSASLFVLAVLTSGSSCIEVDGILSAGLATTPSVVVYARDGAQGGAGYPNVDIEIIGRSTDQDFTGPDGKTRTLFAPSDAEWVRFHFTYYDREGTLHEGYDTAGLRRGVVVTHELWLSSRPPV